MLMTNHENNIQILLQKQNKNYLNKWEK